MVVYPKFIVSLDNFDTLLQEGRSFSPSWEINFQFNRYLSELTREISINSRLDSKTLEEDFLELKATIFPEVINILPKLKRLERTFEAKKLASESVLADSATRTERPVDANPEVRKWIAEGQIQIDGPVDREAVEELIWIYEEQIKNIRRYMERVLEALMRYFPKDIIHPNAVKVVRKAFGEDHPLRQKLEAKIKHLTSVQVSTQNKFVKSKSDRKTNGALGGTIKGKRGYQEFLRWVEVTKFEVKEYRGISNTKFAIVLIDKGFSVDGRHITENTAAKYRARFLSEFDQSLK